MFKFGICFLFAYISLLLRVYQAEFLDNVKTVCLIPDPSDKWGELDNLEASLESAWQKDFQSRLEKLESGQKKIENQLAAILDKLSIVANKIVSPKFEQIGSRYFYIENKIAQNWTSAVNTCRQRGGHLASIQNEGEFNAIKEKLLSEYYWLGINNPDKQGQHVSVATGRPAPFLKWMPGEPDGREDTENCVLLNKNVDMYENPCSDENYFICQADGEY